MRISDWSSDVCSSDLIGADLGDAEMSRAIAAAVGGDTAAIGPELTRLRDAGVSPIPLLRGLVRRLMTIARSEEHTSEIQSLMRISYAVFCLKKKKSSSDTTKQ